MTDIVERLNDLINSVVDGALQQEAADELKHLRAELDELRVWKEEVEKQEPRAWMLECQTLGGDTGWILSWTRSGAGLCNRLEGDEHEEPLYARPIPPAPSVPEGWLRAVDEALIVAHIGAANESDTYEQAKAKLDNLIGFHVDVATDPAVNGGWKLMPVEPTEEIYQCFSAYDGTSYSNPFDRDEFLKDWRAMLEAAPEPEDT